MDLTITPTKLHGAVTPPPSKSQAHRLLIAAALSGGGSTIHNLADSQDIAATRRCLAALGARIDELGENTVQVHGLGNAVVEAGPAPVLDCGESGSTLRFLIPLALLVNGEAAFTGHGRLMERPLKPYEDLFREKGIAWKWENGRLTVDGGRGYGDCALAPGEYRLPGNVSSQFFTGLLFVLPLLGGDSTLVPTTPLESRDYLELTRQVQALAGVRSRWQGDALFIPGGQRYRPFEAAVEADWSQAAFWYAANFLGGEVDILGLDPRSAQGDMAVSELYWRLARNGVTRFTHAARLRMKESDRLRTTAALLAALGGQAEEGPDFLTVRGGPLTGGTVDSANDHRIAMAAAIAATHCAGPVTVLGAECVAKSYPSFWEDYRKLGGITHEHPGT